MINVPKGLAPHEVDLYISAFKFCEKLIQEQNTDIGAAVTETTEKYSFIISDKELFAQFLFREITAYTEPSIGIVSPELDDKTWWSKLKKSEKFIPEYWQRYYDYLNRKPSWSLTAVQDIDSSTDEIMNALANPRSGRACDRMGMVFGYVQSGKTAHYIGLINKAVDAGYRIVVVLTGIHNSLRSQTQSRIDEEVLGYETSLENLADMIREPNVIGVGIGAHNRVKTIVQSITTRDEKGDVNKTTEGVSMVPPFIIVTKKNATVLRRILRFFRKNQCAEVIDGKKIITAKYPALIIDDEADQASINTNDSYDEKGKAFVMENVSMLSSEVHRFYMEKRDEETIERCNIPVKDTLLHLLDAKFMFEKALTIVQSEKEISKYLWAEEDYYLLNVIYKASRSAAKMQKALDKHKKKLLKRAERYLTIAENDHVFAEAKTAFQAVVDFYEGRLAIDRIKDKIEPSIMIQRMLSKAQEIFENNIVVDKYVQDNGLAAQIRSFAVYDYLKKILEAPENDYVIYSDVLCAADYGAPQKRMRFVVIGIKRSISAKIALPKGHFDADEYRTVRDAISDLEDVKPVIDLADDQNGIVLQPKENLSELASSLRNSLILRNHMVTKTTDTAMERFRALKQGQNFHSLKDSMKTNTYTDAARTQNTIYLRLNYDEPSGTVVNVRKSMWIHPTQDRAISVREAARLQTFPDSFVFCGSKDKQYQQVGNAVPPIMAKSIAEKLAQILEKNLAGRERNG